MIRVYLDSPYSPEIRWILDLVARDQQFAWKEVELDLSDLTIGHSKDCDIRISSSFFQRIFQNYFSADLHFSSEFIIRNQWGEEDHLSTIFYLVNGLQEYNFPISECDKFGRFPLNGSAQYQFGVVQKNFVGELISRFMQTHSILKAHIPPKVRKTRVYLSHDIDSLYGSLKHDGKWAFKHFHIGKILEIIGKTVLMNPPWFNIDSIMKMHTEYDMRSTFYWILSHGKDNFGIHNGDYRISNKKIQDQIRKIKAQGFGVGIHKSTFKNSFDEELKRAPFEVYNNRYHFLKFSIPEAWNQLETSGIKLDTSLGFAESIGFRNSYGLPFKPYNISAREAYNFVELPLNIMDASFVYYQNLKDSSVFRNIRNFIERNRTGSILNILWHNDKLSDYYFSDMFKNYKNLLSYLHEERFETVLEDDILREFQPFEE